MELEPWEKLVKTLAEIWAEEDIRSGRYARDEQPENSTIVPPTVDIGCLTKYAESTMRSITFERLKTKTDADPNYRPSLEEIEQIKAEWRAHDEARERELQENLNRKSIRTRYSSKPLVIVDTIEMPPDWFKARVTPEKVQWYLDRNWTLDKIATELGKTVEQVNRVLARAKEPPKSKPKPAYTKSDVPYGWKIQRSLVEPNDLEQWVIEKMTADQKSGKSLDDIAADLEKLGVKPRGGGIWFGRRVSDAIKTNADLMYDWMRSNKLRSKPEKSSR